MAWAYSHLGIDGVGGDLLADVARIAKSRIDEMSAGCTMTVQDFKRIRYLDISCKRHFNGISGIRNVQDLAQLALASKLPTGCSCGISILRENSQDLATGCPFSSLLGLTEPFSCACPP